MLTAFTFGWFWSESGKWYTFWSGFGACLGYAAVFSLAYRKLNCHQSGCHRIGVHKVEGTPYIVCKNHHPGIPAGKVTADHILRAHRRAQGTDAPTEGGGREDAAAPASARANG